ncbi:MAG TPA: MFS transporter [Ktedonobacterales bacterium]|nr:MFS transporter [Ktedonobacterales bacterium]
MAAFRALALRPFALLWSGQTISRLGDSLFTIALAWWVLEKTGSATAMGIVLICSTTPTLLLLLLGGVAVDRLPRLRLMLASDLLGGIVVMLVAFLAYRQWLALWHVFVMSALFGIAEAFFSPAYFAVIPDLVPVEMLPSANSLRSVSLQVAQIVGPGVGAAFIALGGTPLAFALDGLSFFASAACILAISVVAPAPKLHLPAEKEASVLRDLGAGIGAVLHSSWLWLTLLIACVSTIFLSGPDGAALPLLVKQRFGAHVGLYALFTTLLALGSIGASLWLGRFKRLRRRGWLSYGAWAVVGLMVMAVGLPISAGWVGLAFFIQGVALTILGLAWTSSLQEFVPANQLGRVRSIDLLVSDALTPIGYALAGIAADRFGASLVFVLGGAIGAGVIALGLLHPAIRAMD